MYLGEGEVKGVNRWVVYLRSRVCMRGVDVFR